MKILILRTTPNKVNLDTYNLQEVGLAKALVRKGHRCDVAYYGGKEADHFQEIAFDYDKKVRILWLKGYGMFYEGIYPTLGKYIKSYDVIQVGGYVGITASWLNIFHQNKVINYQGPYYYEGNAGDIKKAKIWDNTLLKLQRRENMVVATKSLLATEYIKSKGIANVTTIGVGLDLDNIMHSQDGKEPKGENQNEFTIKLKADKGESKYLLYIGALEDRRNILFLLDVFKSICDEAPNYKLVIIGKGKEDYVEMCMNKIKLLGIENCVIYQQKLEQKYLKAVYECCDAFLLPTHYEIFGMVLLEAMYFGLPVFTTYNGGSSTLMNENNGVVIRDFNVDLWKNKILAVLTDENQRSNIGQAAHDTIVEGYMWDALADKFLDVYRKRVEKTDIHC